MAIDGVYDVEVSMPEGKRSMEITLSTKGTLLSGSVKGPFGEHSFSDGSVSGDNVSWTILLKKESDEESHKGFFGKISEFLSDS